MSEHHLRIAHLTPDMEAHHGGIARAVAGLAGAQQATGHTVAVFAMSEQGGNPGASPEFDLRLTAASPTGRMRFSPGLLEAVREFRPDVIHSHGLWTYFSWAAHCSARRLGVPHICAPHGMLDPWALDSGAPQKRIAALLYQDRVLRRATCLHVLVPEEAAAARAYGLSGPLEVIPNAVPPSLLSLSRDRTAFEQRHPELRNRRIVLFLGRVDPKKGLLNLLRAWRLLDDRSDEWFLVLAGPDRGRYSTGLRLAIERHGLARSVGMLGAQTPTQAIDALLAAELLVLPSFSEGFSMSVLEALACGTPVCISPACHFAEVAEHDAGLISLPTPAALRDNLQTLMALSAEERLAMGNRGRTLVRHRYTWNLIQRRMDALYERLLAPAPAPVNRVVTAEQFAISE